MFVWSIIGILSTIISSLTLKSCSPVVVIFANGESLTIDEVYWLTLIPFTAFTLADAPYPPVPASSKNNLSLTLYDIPGFSTTNPLILASSNLVVVSISISTCDLVDTLG